MTNPFDFFAVDLIVVVLSFGIGFLGIKFLPINKNEVNLDLFPLKLHCYGLLMHIIS